ncbi:MAG: DUF1499 domain-containing protein [Candidatus Binataceae bacterium]
MVTALPLPTWVEIAIAVAALAAIIFVPPIRRVVGTLIGVAIAIGAVFVAVVGTAILMNNVTIYDSPGPYPRVVRFLTVNRAATSEKGSGSAECSQNKYPTESAANPPPPPVRERKPAALKNTAGVRVAAAASPIATPHPSGGAQPEADEYPELVRRGYPGISRNKLFELARQTVNELGGWQVVNAGADTLDCIYTTRVFRFEDEVRITVLPASEIDLCSHSRVAESGSWLRFFPGDFGANIGHIKEFYGALEPKVEAVYKEQEQKANSAER